MDRNLQRALGIILSIACFLTALWAAALAARLLLKGAFLGLFLPVVLIGVVLGLFALIAPLGAAIAGLVLNANSDTKGPAGVLVPLVGFLMALTTGRIANHYDPLDPARPAAYPNCQASRADPSAINRRCPPTQGYDRGECPPGYVCAQSVSHAYEPWFACQVPCTNDCECMAGARCVNASCQFGHNLP